MRSKGGSRSAFERIGRSVQPEVDEELADIFKDN